MEELLERWYRREAIYKSLHQSSVPSRRADWYGYTPRPRTATTRRPRSELDQTQPDGGSRVQTARSTRKQDANGETTSNRTEKRKAAKAAEKRAEALYYHAMETLRRRNQAMIDAENERSKRPKPKVKLSKSRIETLSKPVQRPEPDSGGGYEAPPPAWQQRGDPPPKLGMQTLDRLSKPRKPKLPDLIGVAADEAKLSREERREKRAAALARMDELYRSHFESARRQEQLKQQEEAEAQRLSRRVFDSSPRSDTVIPASFEQRRRARLRASAQGTQPSGEQGAWWHRMQVPRALEYEEDSSAPVGNGGDGGRRDGGRHRPASALASRKWSGNSPLRREERHRPTGTSDRYRARSTSTASGLQEDGRGDGRDRDQAGAGFGAADGKGGYVDGVAGPARPRPPSGVTSSRPGRSSPLATSRAKGRSHGASAVGSAGPRPGSSLSHRREFGSDPGGDNPTSEHRDVSAPGSEHHGKNEDEDRPMRADDFVGPSSQASLGAGARAYARAFAGRGAAGWSQEGGQQRNSQGTRPGNHSSHRLTGAWRPPAAIKTAGGSTEEAVPEAAPTARGSPTRGPTPTLGGDDDASSKPSGVFSGWDDTDLNSGQAHGPAAPAPAVAPAPHRGSSERPAGYARHPQPGNNGRSSQVGRGSRIVARPDSSQQPSHGSNRDRDRDRRPYSSGHSWQSSGGPGNSGPGRSAGSQSRYDGLRGKSYGRGGGGGGGGSRVGRGSRASSRGGTSRGGPMPRPRGGTAVSRQRGRQPSDGRGSRADAGGGGAWSAGLSGSALDADAFFGGSGASSDPIGDAHGVTSDGRSRMDKEVTLEAEEAWLGTGGGGGSGDGGGVSGRDRVAGAKTEYVDGVMLVERTRELVL